RPVVERHVFNRIDRCTPQLQWQRERIRNSLFSLWSAVLSLSRPAGKSVEIGTKRDGSVARTASKIVDEQIGVRPLIDTAAVDRTTDDWHSLRCRIRRVRIHSGTEHWRNDATGLKDTQQLLSGLGALGAILFDRKVEGNHVARQDWV